MKYVRLIKTTSLLFFFILPAKSSFSQPRTINIMIDFKIDDGNFDKAYLIMENTTTGEKQTIPGQAKFNLNLKFNNDYILAFNKPGYIIKKIELNTTAPADRIEQGFYPIGMTVILIKQYEGVNIVVFNQPVSKYKFSKVLDDFAFDTDYTKQIQSALKDAEDQTEQKKKEEKVNAAENAKAAQKAKADSVENAKAEAKAELREEQKQKAEVKAKADAEMKAKNDSILQAKKDALAKVEEDTRQQAKAKQEEDERKKAMAKMEADERAKAAKAQAEEDARKLAAAKLEAEEKAKEAKAKAEEDERKRAEARKEEEERKKLLANSASGVTLKKLPVGTMVSDPKITQSPLAEQGSDPRNIEKSPEVPANVNVEEITENNRIITKATVSKYNKETIYMKIKYKWGGVFYFESDRSISSTAYYLATNLH